MPEGDKSRLPLRVDKVSTNLPYMWNDGGGGDKKQKKFTGSRKQHGEALLKQLSDSTELAKDEQLNSLGDDYLAEKGFILTFTIDTRYKRQLETLDSVVAGIELLNVKLVEAGHEKHVAEATVFVEFGSLKYFVDRLTKYAEEEKNATFADPIEQIGLATLESLWTTEKPLPDSETPVWWEVWIRRGKSDDSKAVNRATVEDECVKLGFRYREDTLDLPEHSIFLLEAKRSVLGRAFGILNCLAEIREPVRASPANTGNAGPTGYEITSLLSPEPGAPSVCVLDTGVNSTHPLLKDVCPTDGCASWKASWLPDDTHGHGTDMCGIAAFGDLRPLRDEGLKPDFSPWVESVKLLNFDEEHEPENYGAVTIDCMAQMETLRKDRQNRVFLMAITATSSPDFPHLAPDGLPTSWSAAIDQATASYLDDEMPRRLFVVSGGNVDLDHPHNYPSDNHDSAFEDPAHSWNAISVGAMTHYHDEETACISKCGGLSPYSKTTRKWVEFGASDCPLKPDVVFEGGNSYAEPFQNSDGLQPVGLNKDHEGGLYCPTGMTSAAAAGVARLAAQIHSRFPELWPETVRALLINSARWNNEMIRGYRMRKKSEVSKLVRTFGYGEPGIERIGSGSENRATFYFEHEIQPFEKVAGKGIGTKDMVVFPLPIPKATLEELGDSEVRFYVTLSYFIEPNPGRRGLAKSKFRYANCGLRFDLKTATESIETFLANRSAKIQEKLDRERGERGETSEGWTIGTNNQDRGSLHHDIWKGRAADLAARDAIIVYPVNGWWKLRGRLGRWNSRQRFALALTIETDGAGHDIYTAVSEEISSLVIPQRIQQIKEMFETEVSISGS